MASFETSEAAKKEIFKTHYYKASYDQIKILYVAYIKSIKHKVQSVNDDYGEVFSEIDDMVVTAKIIMQSPTETSIDFYIDTEKSLGAKGRATEFMQGVYKKLEEKFKLVGLSLHL